MNNRRKLLFAFGASLIAAPLASYSQYKSTKIPRIGIVEFGGPPDSRFVSDYISGLKQLGYSEPASLEVERRFAQGDAERFAELLLEPRRKASRSCVRSRQ